MEPERRHQVDFTYDRNNNKTSFRDANGNITSYAYDDMNNLTAVTDALSNQTFYSYDEAYNLSSITDALNHTTTYSYNQNNQLAEVLDPLGAATRFSYDPAGSLTKTVYPNGAETYYSYTVDDLLENVTYKSEETSYAYEYTPARKLKKVTDNLGKVFSYTYDAGGQEVEQVDTINEALGSFAIKKAYDPISNLTGLKVADEETRTYEYNLRGDLTRLSLPTNPVDTHTTFAYDPARQRTAVSTPDGTTRSYSYDLGGRASTVINETASGVQGFAYSYDANGNITSENSTRYAYDVLNRLSEWFNPATETTTTYTYDAVGNLTLVKEGLVPKTAFSYNPGNEITNEGFTYDANGNLTSDGEKNYALKKKYGWRNKYVLKYKYKNRLRTAKLEGQDLGNIHYGFVGRAAGFPLTVLRGGAGLAQILWANGVKALYDNSWENFFDEERDQYWIIRGYQWNGQ